MKGKIPAFCTYCWAPKGYNTAH